PVHTRVALHQLLVDKEPAQQGEVLVIAAQDVIDLRLLVALCRPKVLGQPAQDDPALLPAGRYLLEAPSFHEVGQDAYFPRVIGAHAQRVPEVGGTEDRQEARTARTTSR